MPPAPKHSRQWFQFELWELLVLVTMLVIVCWQAATRPTTKYFGLGSEKVAVIVSAPGALAARARGFTWSAMTIGVWVVAITVIRRFKRLPVPTDLGSRRV